MVEPGLQPRASEEKADAKGPEWNPRYRTQRDDPSSPGQSWPGVSEGCGFCYIFAGCGLDVGVTHVFTSEYEALTKVLVRESKS